MSALKGSLCLLLLCLSVSSLELTGQSTNAARLGSDSRIPCLITVDKPPVDLNHLTIFWHFLNKEILSYNKAVRTNSSRYSLSTEQLLTGVADLTISNIRISDGGRYKCSVIYNSERREKRLWLDVGDRSSAGIIAACSVSVVIVLIIIIAGVLWWKLKPRMKVIGPFIVGDITGPPKLIDGEEAVLYCTLDNAPEDLCVTWLMRRDGQDKEIQTSQMREHSEEEESLLDTSYVIRSQRLKCQYSSSLSFIPHMERHRDVTFICRGVSGKRTDEKTFHCWIIYVKPKLSKSLTRSRVGPGEIKYLLNLENFNPKNIKTVWTCGVETKGEVVSSTESISENPDRTYNVSSEIIIPEDRHKDPGFRVRVTWYHESIEEPESRELFISGKPQMSAPIEITIADKSCVRFSLNLQKFYPEDINISWYREDQSGKCGLSAVEPISARDDDLTYQVTSVVLISKYLFRDPEMKIIVEWKHERMETPETRSLSVRDLPWRPRIGSISVPNLEDGKSATLTCEISGYFPDLLSVFWLSKKDGNMTDLPIKSSNADVNYKVSNKEKKQTDNTYSCVSSVTFTPVVSLYQGSEIICRVEHPSEEHPIERSTGPLHIREEKLS
ncbi:uncharacterized protein [Phyllobates terribilis]|uniref:uncharacterized protein isoform X2 n=1 Tax=Phyllobates terribilis TaxID=111132 RepID=UPI003CCB1D57